MLLIDNIFGKGKVEFNYQQSKYNHHYHKLRCDYYSRLNRITTFEDLSNLIETKSRTLLKTQFKVKFKNIEFNSSLTDIIKTLGNPKFEVYGNIKNHKVLFYKYKISNLKITLMFHFIENLFFIGQYLFKTQIPAEIELIEKTLKNKYLNFENIDLTKTVIYDNENNRIKLEKDFNLIINYISGNKKIIYYLGNEFLKNETKIKAIKNRNLESLNNFL